MADISFSKPNSTSLDRGPDTGLLSRTDHRETAETYSGELFRHGIYRVAVCRDGIQWLFQRQRPQFPTGGAAWDTLGYCVSKSGLTRFVRAHIGCDDPDLDALPAHFQQRCRDE
ncbi:MULTISPECIES: hypothetical protein [unclassified Ruegeria]|uniref:hypothetical protein n=1 Tax=unclassified Ruegeria TaxID=2625375 RepID=UPI001490C8B2|nr:MULTISPECIES: hypothetical protein [unclassified Ruegeria]NOD90989.1 hypothetical protein [Ruegeria sp. HKCCD4318]NOE16367.1 hypothetical protein [Ruegeria sp. HKCCD4318-2]NOG10158.1 hypothetical protein [Ruegeria sp. HKCCD4315]